MGCRRRNPIPGSEARQPEDMNLWAPPWSGGDKVNVSLIRARETRMSLAELKQLPPVVFVGMSRNITLSGTVSLRPGDLYHTPPRNWLRLGSMPLGR